MPGRVLIVEDSATNRLLIRARLSAAYYEVIEADTGEAGLAIAVESPPDIVLLDLMLPGIDGFEVCRRLKADPATAHVPVVMLTALDDPVERVRGLETGADDFLSKPCDDVALLSRVASLIRMKVMVDELALRGETAGTGAAGGIDTGRTAEIVRATAFPDSRVLVVSGRRSTPALATALERAIRCSVETRRSEAEARPLLASGGFDAVLIDPAPGGGDPLRLGSLVRARRETRQTATLLVVDPGDSALAARALEIGFSDYIARPVDPAELIARVRLQLRRKLYADRLREDVRDSMVQALTDPLTGAWNRRYATAHLDAMLERCRARSAPVTVMMIDLDRFKDINDRHGHPAGDLVLREFARRLQANVRGIDLVARIGGEEFMVVLPEAGRDAAAEVAERVRAATAEPPFRISETGDSRAVTVSIGYAVMGSGETGAALVRRADAALYASKRSGRNRATLSDAA